MRTTIARKRKLLRELARHRQTHVPLGYKGIGEYHGGVYECDFVSPYTKSAQNLAADIMLVLQDWCSDEFLRGPGNPEVIALGTTRSCQPTGTSRGYSVLISERNWARLTRQIYFPS